MPSPALTPEEAFAVDRAATERFGIPSIVLMENAGRAAAREALALLPAGGDAGVVLGKGKNAGDGLVAARTLRNRGVDAVLYAVFPLDDAEGDVAANLRMARAMGLRFEAAPPRRHALLVDAVFGIGLSREVQGAAREAIEAMNASGARILAVDVPSGLDARTGLPRGAAVRAHATVTMGFLKTGFLNPASKEYTGRVVVAEIGYPRELLEPRRP
jgi:NAD(P)H-hydrate epimerase